MEQLAQTATQHSILQPSSNALQDPSPPSLDILGRRRISVTEYAAEPDVPDHDYASRPPPDEELPEYDATIVLPVYIDRHLQNPVASYCIYQVGRKLQCITPADMSSFDRPRYRLSARASPSLFSKKADFTLTRLPGGRQAALGNCPERDVATMSFDRNGAVPWMPRATVCQGDCASNRKPYRMRATNFKEWTIDIDQEVFTWRIADNPTSLTLVEHTTDSIVARFSYSELGTDATRGAEVGRLDVYGGSVSEEQDTIELVIASCKVAVEHLKNMGRHYRNGSTPRSHSVTTDATTSSFVTSMSGMNRRASHIIF
jgi:hypothetical protein